MKVQFYNQVHIDVYKTHDGHRVETAVFGGTNYHKTLISMTNQIGCQVRCDFCFGNKYHFVRNIEPDEFLQQVVGVVESDAQVPWLDRERPVKVGFQRAGEALLNENFLDGLVKIADRYKPSFQLTTIMPNAKVSYDLIGGIKQYLHNYPETFQINVSMHTSDEDKRKEMMRNFPQLMKFKEIAEFGEKWVREVKKRRIDLSFVLMEDNEVDLGLIRELFDPKYFSIRLAFYLPSSEETAQRHKPSGKDRMNKIADEARKQGYHCIESVAGPIEKIWDTRPFSALKMLRDDS